MTDLKRCDVCHAIGECAVSPHTKYPFPPPLWYVLFRMEDCGIDTEYTFCSIACVQTYAQNDITARFLIENPETVPEPSLPPIRDEHDPEVDLG